MEPYHEPQNIPLLPNVDNIKGEKRDEEANNGPLDFSLHRPHDCDLRQITLEDINSITLDGVPSQLKNFGSCKPRVKLTLRESSDQREKRLLEGRLRMKRLRSTESEERREVRLQKARFWQGQRRERERQLESSEQKEYRLALARERIKLRRAQETPDERERRLKRSRERSRMKRAHENEDERLKRLNRQRTNKRDRYHSMTREEKTQLRQREKLCRGKSTRPGVRIKYNEDEELDSYFNVQGDSADEGANDGTMWVPEPEVCLSVDSSDKSAQPLNSGDEHSPSTYLMSENSLNLQEQISQHVSNLVLHKKDSFSETPMTRQFEESVIRESMTTDMQPLEGFYVGSTSGQSANSIESHKDGMLKRQGFEYMRMNPTIENEGFNSLKNSTSGNVENIDNGRFEMTKATVANSIPMSQGQYLSSYKSNNQFSSDASSDFTPNQISNPNHHTDLNKMHQMPQERYEIGN